MTTANDFPAGTTHSGAASADRTDRATWRIRIDSFSRPTRAVLLAGILLTPLYVVVDLHWGIGLLPVWASAIFFAAAFPARAARQLRVPAGRWLLGAVPPVLVMGLLAAVAAIAWSAHEIALNPYFDSFLLSRSGDAPHVDMNGVPYLVPTAGFSAGDMAVSFAVIVLVIAAAAYFGIALAALSARRSVGSVALTVIAVIVAVTAGTGLIAWLLGGTPFSRDYPSPLVGWQMVAGPAIVASVVLAGSVPGALRTYRRITG